MMRNCGRWSTGMGRGAAIGTLKRCGSSARVGEASARRRSIASTNISEYPLSERHCPAVREEFAILLRRDRSRHAAGYSRLAARRVELEARRVRAEQSRDGDLSLRMA